MRVIVHAGFHRTGTTSIQHMMQRNARKLARHFRILTRRQMPGLCEAARAWSLSRDAADLGLVTFELAQILEPLDPTDARPLVLSSEDLSGHMPGRFHLSGYDAAPPLMASIQQTVQTCLPGADLAFFFTTRAASPWLHSTWAQHVRAIRFTEPRDAYIARMAPHTDLAAQVARIANTVTAPVHSARLEDCADAPYGPFSPLLDLMQASPKLRAKLTALPPSNPSFPDPVLAQFLALNQSDLSREVLAEAKKTLMEDWRRQTHHG